MQNNNNDVMFEAFASYGTNKWNKSHYNVSKGASDKKTKQIKTKYEIIEGDKRKNADLKEFWKILKEWHADPVTGTGKPDGEDIVAWLDDFVENPKDTLAELKEKEQEWLDFIEEDQEYKHE